MEEQKELYVSDTVLYIYPRVDKCYAHVKTKEKPRLTDGKRHPVKIIKKGEDASKKG